MRSMLAILLVCAASVFAAGIPLPEHPRPDWERTNWLNLNGEWKFAFDGKNVGEREKVNTLELPDDPADHRGILSWFSQKRDDTLSDAGSYGWLVEAEISAEVMAKGKGVTTIRLETAKGGLAVYGEKFGRLPLDPSLSF